MKQNNKVIKTSSIFLKKKGKVLFLLVPFIVIHLFLTYGIEMIIVNGESMEPAYSHGDVVFVLKMPHSYEYGDVVVAVHDNYHVLKRVTGEPEDIVNINEAENIGDVKMPHTILKDSYFLLGDNRSISYDSRFSDFGDIHKDKIIGKVIYKLQRRTN